MKCPYCNKEMEKGYIQSKHGLGWNRKKRVLAVILGAVMTMSLAACGSSDAGKIIIDYNQQEE